MGIDILYQDDDLVAVAKPSGQMTIPGRGEIAGDPLNIELEKKLKRKLFVVHRLDRGASGLVLFAKNAATHRQLSLQFENREVQKSYVVLVQGHIEAAGQIDHPLKPFGSGRMGIHPLGKASTTRYKLLEPLADTTLLDVSPLSGRRHQIRVHLYSIGHPVMGDPLYGKDRPVGGVNRLMLHARMLEFISPKGEKITLTAPIPSDFVNVLNTFHRLGNPLK